MIIWEHIFKALYKIYKDKEIGRVEIHYIERLQVNIEPYDRNAKGKPSKKGVQSGEIRGRKAGWDQKLRPLLRSTEVISGLEPRRRGPLWKYQDPTMRIEAGSCKRFDLPYRAGSLGSLNCLFPTLCLYSLACLFSLGKILKRKKKVELSSMEFKHENEICPAKLTLGKKESSILS